MCAKVTSQTRQRNAGINSFNKPAFQTLSATDRLLAVHGGAARQARVRDGGAPKKKARKSNIQLMEELYVARIPRQEPTQAQLDRLELVKARDELVTPNVKAFLKAKTVKDYEAVKDLRERKDVQAYIEANDAIRAFDKKMEALKNAEIKANAKTEIEAKTNRLAETRAILSHAKKERLFERNEEAIRREIRAEVEAAEAKRQAPIKRMQSLINAMNEAWRV